MTIDQMNDLERIRQLKARYFRLMDTQQWEAWADCSTADVSASYEGRRAARYFVLRTRNQLYSESRG
jgi:hypothetical protein